MEIIAPDFYFTGGTSGSTMRFFIPSGTSSYVGGNVLFSDHLYEPHTPAPKKTPGQRVREWINLQTLNGEASREAVKLWEADS